MLKGIIIKNISNSYTVFANNKKYICTPRGRFRKEKQTPLVGDYCKIDEENNYILELLPRKNELQRPNVCNIDIGLIVVSLVQPNINTTLLDKEITSILLAKVQPVICFTKLDLAENKEELLKLKKYYETIGIPCFDNQNLDKLQSFLQNKVVVLTGQTGAGKSTLLNRLEPNLNLKTDEISFSLNRGKHTTRHTEIHQINHIAFCDTPGFSSLEITNVSKEEIKDSFVEFQDYCCKFKDCLHLNERDCEVKKAVEEGKILTSRYDSYQKMIKECQK